MGDTAKFRIAIVTTSPLMSNPRVVKEARALAWAGYRVTVFCGPSLPSLAEFERQQVVELKGCQVISLDWGQKPLLRYWSRLRQGLALSVFRRLGLSSTLAYCRLHPELLKLAVRVDADLFIAHNLTALPTAVRAAQRRNALVAFDAEDYHSGQLPTENVSKSETRLTQLIERRYIPLCGYVTAASDGIGAAYTEMLGIKRPATMLNVFPLSDASLVIPQEELIRERSQTFQTLYWFSQTIGPDRGLESAVKALAYLPDNFRLVLRGTFAAGYEEILMSLARSMHVDQRLVFHGPALASEMVVRAACHDVGLALEVPTTRNRDICVTNKLFTYLLAGIPCVLSNTAGQRPFARTLPHATSLMCDDSPRSLARSVNELMSRYDEARREAKFAAQSVYNWDAESRILLRQVAEVLAKRTHPLNSGRHIPEYRV